MRLFWLLSFRRKNNQFNRNCFVIRGVVSLPSFRLLHELDFQKHALSTSHTVKMQGTTSSLLQHLSLFTSRKPWDKFGSVSRPRYRRFRRSRKWPVRLGYCHVTTASKHPVRCFCFHTGTWQSDISIIGWLARPTAIHCNTVLLQLRDYIKHISEHVTYLFSWSCWWGLNLKSCRPWAFFWYLCFDMEGIFTKSSM